MQNLLKVRWENHLILFQIPGSEGRSVCVCVCVCVRARAEEAEEKEEEGLASDCVSDI